MDVLIIVIIAALCLVAFGVAYAAKRGSRSGGNDNVWHPSEDRQGTGTHDGSSQA